MIINKKILAIIIIIYSIILIILAPLAWIPSQNKVVIYPGGIRYILGIENAPEPASLAYENNTKTLNLITPSGKIYIWKNITPLITCSSNKSLAYVASSGNRERIVVVWNFYKNSGEIIKYKSQGMPIACTISQGRLAIIDQNPLEGDKLILIDNSSGRAFFYKLPSSLLYMSSVRIEGSELIISGSAKYALFNISLPMLKGAKYNILMENSSIFPKINGIEYFNGKFILYGKAFIGGPSSTKTRAIILIPDIRKGYIVNSGNKDTITWAAVPAGIPERIKLLVEIKGSRLDILELNLNKGIIESRSKLVVMAPYIFQKADEANGIIYIVLNLYPEKLPQKTAVVEVVDDGRVVLGENYTFVLLSFQEDTDKLGVETINYNVVSSNIVLKPYNEEKISIIINNLTTKTAKSIKTYGAVRDLKLLFCASFSVVLSFLSIPLYIFISRSRPFEYSIDYRMGWRATDPRLIQTSES